MFRGTRVLSRSRVRFGYGAFTLSGSTFQWTLLHPRFLTPPQVRNPAKTAPQPPRCNGCSLTQHGFGLLPFRSPLLGESRLISLPPGTEMFQFPGFAPIRLWIQRTVAGFSSTGFPIRKSTGHSLCSDSPWLFAATYVLHRLLVPRHPPSALSSLASSSQRRLLHPSTPALAGLRVLHYLCFTPNPCAMHTDRYHIHHLFKEPAIGAIWPIRFKTGLSRLTEPPRRDGWCICERDE